jgi:hypothetical protein
MSLRERLSQHGLSLWYVELYKPTIMFIHQIRILPHHHYCPRRCFGSAVRARAARRSSLRPCSTRHSISRSLRSKTACCFWYFSSSSSSLPPFSWPGLAYVLLLCCVMRRRLALFACSCLLPSTILHCRLSVLRPDRVMP